MYLRKENIFASEISKEQAASLKQSYGIRRIPPYFLSLLGAAHDMALKEEEKEGLGIIYVSHLGPVDQIHKYVNDLLTYQPEDCSPAYFSHSVFNAPAAFLTKHLNLHCSCLSVCGFRQIIESSVLTAYSWLKTGYCSRVMMIFTDDISEISLKISDLTGLRLFKNHYILLVENAPEGATDRIAPEQLIEHVKQTFEKEKKNGFR